MDQFIFASLSHIHYWYGVGMLKVPAVGSMTSVMSVALLLMQVPSRVGVSAATIAFVTWHRKFGSAINRLGSQWKA